MTSAKPYSIPKSIVWEAYQQVKANRGAAGIDNQSIEMFEQDLSKNLYKLWNRMSSGSYFPPPVKQVEIPKANGGRRKLGIPTVADRVAQTVAKLIVEPIIDPVFHPDSYGYRPSKSAKQAITITRRRCWEHDWVVEFDIKAAFDQIDHVLLMKAVRVHVKEKWVLMYIERWLKAPFETKTGESLPRDRGTPQGGVISPLLMNLFMHYVFDHWMKINYPNCPFARYADDAVVHCDSEAQASHLMKEISLRLEACGLMMHPDKSKVVYCKDSNRKKCYPTISFTFLGFTFQPRYVRSKAGRLFTSYLPGASNAALKRIRDKVRGWNLTRRTTEALKELVRECNAEIRGWWNYYGTFFRKGLNRIGDYIDEKIKRWARRKYKTLRGKKARSEFWLRKVKEQCPDLLYHWYISGAKVG